MSDIQEHEELSRTDNIDRACGLALLNTEENVRRARQATAPERVPDGNGGWIEQKAREDGSYPIPDCVDCEDPIPLLRLQMGRIRCVGCQTAREPVKRK